MSQRKNKTSRRLSRLSRELTFEERRLVQDWEQRVTKLLADLDAYVAKQDEIGPDEGLDATLLVVKIATDHLEAMKKIKDMNSPLEAKPIVDEAFTTAYAALELHS